MAARSACEELGFERALALRRQDLTIAVAGAHNRVDPGACDAQLGRILPDPSCALSKEMIQRGHATLVTNVRLDPRVALPQLGPATPHAFAAAPITSSGETLGFLCADYQSHCAINVRDRDRLACLATAVGLTLRVTQLEGRLREVSQQARSLVHLTSGPARRLLDLRPDQRSLAAAENRFAMLTKREHDVLRQIALGRTNLQIAESLGITRETAKSHVKRVNGKLGTTNRTEAAALYQRLHAW